MKNSTLEERFWEKVNRTNSCWLWIGQNSNTYGRLETHVPVRRIYLAHRLSWTIHFGEIPKNLHVLHRCDNTICVNPKHLFLGTQRDNNADKIDKGRNAKGNKFPHAKLNPIAVRRIRKAYATGKVTQTALATKYGVAISQINGVVNGKTWRHI